MSFLNPRRLTNFGTVPESAVTPNNTAGGIHFDASPAVFDIDVYAYMDFSMSLNAANFGLYDVRVNEYLSGTGQAGGMSNI